MHAKNFIHLVVQRGGDIMLDGWATGKALGGVGEQKIKMKIYCMKN